MIRFCLLILIITFGINCFGQTINDTIYSSTRLVPRFGINIQKGYGIEAGLYLNKFYTRFPKHELMKLLPYASSGFFVSSELSLKDFDRLIIGPKIGWELGVIGETHGSYFGVEFINYTDFNKYNPSLMLKIGLPLMWLNIGYGYTMFIENSLKNDIGKHRVTISYSINRKADREYKRIQNNLNNRQKKE
ncbi:MAG: hypothetical protein KAT68_16860 [Bacteroidales bacterium]|nr:hypothetical protein [Bacteroidales bacterium]